MAKIALLQTLCRLNGISGWEDSVRDFILQEITPHVADVQVDPLGNIIAWKKGTHRPGTELMLSAHMDEVGLVVTHITEEGYLKVATVGGIDQRILPGKQVMVGKDILGVIGVKPVHLLKGEEKGAALEVEALYIDIGAANQAEAEAVVSLGDPVQFCSISDLSGGMVRMKAIDDRAGCAILIDLIQQELAYDMTFVFCVQEEIGLRGAKAAAYTVDPQAALVVESTTAADLPDLPPEKQVCQVGQGPVLSFMDRATIYDREYFQLAQTLAKENGIPYQIKQAVAGGNDAGAIHTSKSGVRTLAVSLPCRYLHSPVGVIAQSDYHHAEQLLLLLANTIAGS